jgi:hypothetical protein
MICGALNIPKDPLQGCKMRGGVGVHMHADLLHGVADVGTGER